MNTTESFEKGKVDTSACVEKLKKLKMFNKILAANTIETLFRQQEYEEALKEEGKKVG